MADFGQCDCVKQGKSSGGTVSSLAVCARHLLSMCTSNYMTALDLKSNLLILLKELFSFLFCH